MSFLIKIVSYIASVLYYLAYLLCILFFHPIQWVSLNLFGYQTHKISVDYLSICLSRCLLFLGTSVKFINAHNIPKGKPIIIVSNHQSTQDIAPLMWLFSANHPKYVAKIELTRGIPSLSYNLRHGGSVLIDRNNAKQSITALKNFAQYIEKNNYAAIIFPEGTRSKDGKPIPFKDNGLKVLVKYMPSAVIVPVTINNSWKVYKNGKFPLHLFDTISLTVHEPVEANTVPFNQLFNDVEKTIIAGIE